MKSRLHYSFFGSMALLSLSACVGTQTAMHMTSSNFGIDVDTTPPTTEIGLSRTELAVQPSFANGQTPSSVMSFEGKAGNGWGSGVISNFFFGTGSTFATGQAAANLTATGTGGSSNTDTVEDEAAENEEAEAGSEANTAATKPESVNADPNKDEIGLNGLPARPNIFKLLFSPHHRYRPFKENEMFPLITGTKTVYGLDVNWDPATQSPRAIKAGFNRKEVSFAPMIASGIRSGEMCKDDPTKCAADSEQPIKLKLPSVIAGHQMNTTVGTSASFGHVQFLATGKAAENLGNNTEVRSVLVKKLTTPTQQPNNGSGSGSGSGSGNPN